MKSFVLKLNAKYFLTFSFHLLSLLYSLFKAILNLLFCMLTLSFFLSLRRFNKIF